MPKVKFIVPSYEEIAITIYYLVKDKKKNYRENIYIEFPKNLINKIINNNLNIVKKEIIQSIQGRYDIKKLEVLKKEIEEIWNPLNDLFFRKIEKITGFKFPFKSITIYMTDIVRGMYTPENKIFINPLKNMTSYITAEELFHLHYWNIFRKIIKDVKLPWRINKKIWEISEVVPEFILMEDNFNFFGWNKNFYRGYFFVEKLKEELLPIWENKKNFQEFMIKIHENLI